MDFFFNVKCKISLAKTEYMGLCLVSAPLLDGKIKSKIYQLDILI